MQMAPAASRRGVTASGSTLRSWIHHRSFSTTKVNSEIHPKGSNLSWQTSYWKAKSSDKPEERFCSVRGLALTQYVPVEVWATRGISLQYRSAEGDTMDAVVAEGVKDGTIKLHPVEDGRPKPEAVTVPAEGCRHTGRGGTPTQNFIARELFRFGFGGYWDGGATPFLARSWWQDTQEDNRKLTQEEALEAVEKKKAADGRSESPNGYHPEVLV